jgi:hypothetical protein
VTVEAGNIRPWFFKEDLQIFRGCDVTHQLAGNDHAILEDLFRRRQCQSSTSPREAALDLGSPFNSASVTGRLVLHQRPVFETRLLYFVYHTNLLDVRKILCRFKQERHCIPRG